MPNARDPSPRVSGQGADDMNNVVCSGSVADGVRGEGGHSMSRGHADGPAIRVTRG